MLSQLSYEDPYTGGWLNSINWPASGIWVFIDQLGEYCSANAEAMGSNPIETPKNFFWGYFCNCLNCDSLRWSHTHFICIPAVHIISLRFGFVFGSPELNSPHFVNRQLICLLPVGILNLLCLQSVHVTRDRVLMKSEARVQIYVAVMNIGCEIQNSSGNVVSFSKILNSHEVPFYLFLFKNMRNIRLLGV